MMESKRKFKRFDLEREVKFRPTYGATEYSSGVAYNLSCGGLGLDAHDFRFIIYENLELVVNIPGNEIPVALSGDIMWKIQDSERCRAGIKFRTKDTIKQEAALGQIFSSLGIPATYMYNHDFEYIVQQEALKISEPGICDPKRSSPKLPNKLGFIKQYIENGSKCKVTFRLLREVAKNPHSVTIVGDFNDWDVFKSPMTRLPGGDFAVTMELDSKKEFRFGYLIDGHRWEIDWYADKFVRNEQGAKYSVVVV
ncbi:MAG: PilZ domain-containing protein [Nitrospirae bacterium]|nr:PilZ domain-containing protein [Nitrospirota bacterium]